MICCSQESNRKSLKRVFPLFKPVGIQGIVCAEADVGICTVPQDQNKHGREAEDHQVQ